MPHADPALRTLPGMSRRRRTAACFVICVTMPLLAVACTHVQPGPQVNASAFLSDWTARNWQGMRQLADTPPPDFTAVNQAAITDLGITKASFTTGTMVTKDNTASEPVTEHLTLAGAGPLTIKTSLHLTQNQQGTWLVDWSPSVKIGRASCRERVFVGV